MKLDIADFACLPGDLQSPAYLNFWETAASPTLKLEHLSSSDLC